MNLDFTHGDAVIIDGYTYGKATFLEYGDPRHSCPDTHITFPGMRIAYVEFERYGRQPSVNCSDCGQEVHMARNGPALR